MIDFVYKLKDILPQWPTDSTLSVEDISSATETSVPHVIQYFSDGLKKSLDVTDKISHDEAKTALVQLTRELRSELEARSRELAQKQAQTLEAYERMMLRMRRELQGRNWPKAFRTLSYFAGENRENLPDDYLISLCSDIVRIGIKAGENIQELGRWLEMAVAVGLHQNSKEGVEEALDLIDAYSEDFLQEDTGKGALLLGNLLSAIEERAARFGLWEEYGSLINQLYPEHH
ncbi:MAG: hypothetical protein OXC44_04130 [Proteobacteria bacterium]|nr:hypothetical protein [Pseudomonadota bacterium]